jgi:hypothetical protein
MTAARKAERGATSMDCVQERRMRKVRARGRVVGTGIRARAMAEGRWVKTMVWKEIDVSCLIGRRVVSGGCLL